MKINSVEVSFSKKVQVTQYEPCESTTTISASLEKGETLSSVVEKLQKLAAEFVYNELGREMEYYEVFRKDFEQERVNERIGAY